MQVLKKIMHRWFSKPQPPRPQLDYKEIRKYRQFDVYQLDLEVYPAQEIFIPQKLPSEPPEGILYRFGPSGYMGDSSSDYCVIPTTWWYVNNYCHWNFSELPFLFLAFESDAPYVVLPDGILDASLAFHTRWMEVFAELYPQKKVLRLSEISFPVDALFPVNHDSSFNKQPIGKGKYMNYHVGRATPYLIEQIEKKYKFQFDRQAKNLAEYQHIYINRKRRRLKNESSIQRLVRQLGFTVVTLETLSLDEQVAIFSHTKTVMGFHGAGLSNLLYANSSTQVFEIVDRDVVHPCFMDGVVIPGKKATRTYFHMLSVMKGMDYHVFESNDYYLDEAKVEKRLISLMH